MRWWGREGERETGARSKGRTGSYERDFKGPIAAIMPDMQCRCGRP